MPHIALLQGGWSSEREVSLRSGAVIKNALDELGHKVSVIDVKPDIGKALTELRPDCVFNALHGQYGEDGTIQGLLELLSIPYTHSGVLASALAMHKVRAKSIFQSQGLRCPEGGTYNMAQIRSGQSLPMPYIVKPIADGSSVNVSLIRSEQDLDALNHLSQNDIMLVERYIKGREIQVAVLNGKALGAVEIQYSHDIYDYAAKYDEGGSTHIMPAPLAKNSYEFALKLAEKAHQALGCRGLTRTDFIYDDQSLGESLFYLLELNTQPGFTPTSLAPEIAAHAGINFTSLVQHMLDAATTDGAAHG